MKAARSIQKAPVRILAEAALKPETAWVAALAAAQEGAEARRREAILASAVWIQSQAFLKQRAVPETAAQRQKQVVLKQRTAPETAGKTKKTKTQNPGILPVRAVRRQKTAVMINQQHPVRKLLSEPGRRKTVRQPET